MPHSELMPIGVFAQHTGLTASALRFYADSGLLPPAEVDPVSGYRYYGAEQGARATALRQLREIAMPLAAVEEDPGVRLPATVTGPALEIRFEMTTLYPAVSTAIGPDVMLDLRGHDRPVTVRSADRGDLITLAMPVPSDHPA
ncbi:MerR family transcriptional regulator [Streptomyces sp. NPDC004031]